MWIRAATGLAAGIFALGGGVAASAATTARHPLPPVARLLPAARPASPAAVAHPLISGNVWEGADGYMWYDASSGQFFASSSMTPLSAATDCNGSGFCEHTLPNGKCLEWESGPNTVSAGTCSGIDRQLWSLADGDGDYLWFNDYANFLFPSKGFCVIKGEQLEPVLTAEPTSGDQLDMRCPGQGPGTNYQLWIPNP